MYPKITRGNQITEKQRVKKKKWHYTYGTELPSRAQRIRDDILSTYTQ